MPKRYTLEEVRQMFSNRNWVLLSDSYINSTTHLIALCNKGHEVRVTLDSFRSNGCKICYDLVRGQKVGRALRKQDPVEFVESLGYKPLEPYVNNGTSKDGKKWKLLCPKGHIWEVNYNAFQKGTRCGICHSKKHYSKDLSVGGKAYLRVKDRIRTSLNSQFNHTTFWDIYDSGMIRSLSDPIEYLYETCRSGYVVDHIVPFSWFSSSSFDEMKYCWHPDNLRQLSYQENIRKRNSLSIREFEQHLVERPNLAEIVLAASYSPDNIRTVALNFFKDYYYSLTIKAG